MTATEQLRTALYLRISSDQRDRAGVERQERECRELADRLGWQVAAGYQDNDISAFTGKRRPGYDALLASIKAGETRAVICWHSDRLQRQPGEQDTYIKLCQAHGVQTAAVQVGSIDYSTPSGEMNARILGVVAHFESQHKAERIRAAHRQKAEKGEHHRGIRPFGYEKDGVTVRESEAAEIRKLADGLLAGQSLRSMALDLNQPGTTGHNSTAKRVTDAGFEAPANSAVGAEE